MIVDISQTGLGAGLEFELFKPSDEVPSEFYAELPIDLTVLGTYHQFGEFVSGVAALPRIVTTHDIEIDLKSKAAAGAATKKDLAGGNRLVMKAVAKTYRALDEEEESEVEQPKKAGAKK